MRSFEHRIFFSIDERVHKIIERVFQLKDKFLCFHERVSAVFFREYFSLGCDQFNREITI